MSTTYHEPTSELSAGVREVHRALASLIEELEAVDWYNQRADVSRDAGLKDVLTHNRDEEIEHAAMALEWLRRRMPKLDEELRTYLFTSEPIAHVADGQQRASSGAGAAGERSGDLGIGNLKKERNHAD